jgi:membrane associated rhomboid family serine protease
MKQTGKSMDVATLKFRLGFMLYPMLLMVGVYVLGMFIGSPLYEFGLVPRSMASLPHIFTAPFIHGSWAHLFGNLTAFAVFSALCLIRGERFYIKSSLFILVCTGLLVWIFGRSSSHIGASGWIFGLWSLSIAMAWFERKFLNILIAVVVLFFYGGMIFGVLPGVRGVSFESHLFGALSGILCAVCFSTSRSTLKK